MVSQAEVEEIAEFIKTQIGHPLGLANARMFAEFSELLKKMNRLKAETNEFRKRWNMPEGNGGR